MSKREMGPCIEQEFFGTAEIRGNQLTAAPASALSALRINFGKNVCDSACVAGK
jgi:hypothetical protein